MSDSTAASSSNQPEFLVPNADENNGNDAVEDTAIPSLRFPQKLWRIVNECKSGAISWGSNGQTVKINYKSFQREFLAGDTSIFKTSNIASFIRQLNLYGFRKLTINTRDPFAPIVQPQPPQDDHEFVHEHFREGRLDLLSRVCRKTGTKKSGQAGLKRRASATSAGVVAEVKTMVPDLAFPATMTMETVKIEEPELEETENPSFSRLQMCQIALTEALEQATSQYKREKLWLQLANRNFFNQVFQPKNEPVSVDDNVQIVCHDVPSNSEDDLQQIDNFTMENAATPQDRNQWQEVLSLPNDAIISISIPYQ